MAPETAVTAPRPADVGLRRELGLIGATWSSETSIIGSGWLFGALFAAQAAGTAALVGWVIAGAAVAVLALVLAELGAMYPVAGGTARFPHFAFGSVAGISFGFFSWLGAVTTAPVECYAVFTYLSYYWPGAYNPNGTISAAGLWATVGLMAVFTAVNFVAMRQFARVNNVITWWKVAVPVLAIVVLFVKFQPVNFGAGGGFMPFGIKGLFGAIPAGIVFAYGGFEQADQLAGEIKDPQRNLARAIIIATAIAAAIYILLQVAFIGAITHDMISGPRGWLGIPKTSPIAIGPFAGLAGAAGLAWLATILRIDAVVSPSGTGLIYTTATSRIGYGLARNRYCPQIFAAVDRRGVPWVSLIFAFAFGLVFLLPFPSWHSLASLVVGAGLLMYAGVPLSLGAFRRQVPEANRPYRVPAAAVLGPVAFIIANLLIYWSSLEVVWKLGVCIVIGYALIGVSMAFDKQRPPLDWKSAQWLPVYLIGLGIISWQGQYSGEFSTAPPVNTGRIPFWWDMLVVAAFSLAIYYWAQATKLPRAEMMNLINRQAAPPTEQAAGGYQ